MKKSIPLLYLISALCISSIYAEADWTMLTIIQADNNLAPFAIQNINDVQKNISGDKVNKVIYWHRPRSQQRIRGSIKPNGITDEEIIEIKSAPNMEKEVIDAMQWAVKKYPAKHYMLNLWDHGTGVIDQSVWGSKLRNLLRSHIMGGNAWIEMPWMGTVSDRGILYSDSTKTYLNNQQLANACKHIKEVILKRNIDIVGMDACVMAMLEIGYQIKDYADLLVSSQNLEPGRGWNYGAFIKQICTNSSVSSPLKVAQYIVDSYAQYYSGRYTFYTLSALDLSLMNDIKKNIEEVITHIFECHTAQVQGIFSCVKHAALSSTKFDSFEFIDLHSFYTQLIKQVKNKTVERRKKGHFPIITPSQEALLHKLRATLEAGAQTILKSVKYNKAGPNFPGARGISIYFPHGNFHPSYARTRFAADTSWAYLVQAANLQQVPLKPSKQ